MEIRGEKIHTTDYADSHRLKSIGKNLFKSVVKKNLCKSVQIRGEKKYPPQITQILRD